MNMSKKKQRKLKIKNITIYVTREDIKKGVKSSLYKCPIARAIARKRIKSICSGMPLGFPYGKSDAAKYKRKEYEILSRAPNAAVDFMHKFDDEGKVKPFSFVMQLREVEY